MKAPDADWLPFLKMVFGFLILLFLVILAGAIALGHVEEKTSFGLHDIITCLSTLSGGFVVWAFNSDKDK
jgi:hypothetical protein